MSTSATTGAGAPNIVDTIKSAGETYNKSKSIFRNLAAGIKIIFAHAKASGSILQIAGAAALAVAAIAAVSTGILASITGLGIPVGLSLVGIGVGMFAAGSALIWKDIGQKNPDIPFRDRIKEFFRIGGKNTAIGAAVGGIGAVAVANAPVVANVLAIGGTAAAVVGKYGAMVNKALGDIDPIAQQIHGDGKIEVKTEAAPAAETAPTGVVSPEEMEKNIGGAVAALVS